MKRMFLYKLRFMAFSFDKLILNYSQVFCMIHVKIIMLNETCIFYSSGHNQYFFNTHNHRNIAFVILKVLQCYNYYDGDNFFLVLYTMAY